MQDIGEYMTRLTMSDHVNLIPGTNQCIINFDVYLYIISVIKNMSDKKIMSDASSHI